MSNELQKTAGDSQQNAQQNKQLVCSVGHVRDGENLYCLMDRNVLKPCQIKISAKMDKGTQRQK